VEYVDNKEDTLIQTVVPHKHNINSTLLQTAGRFKTELRRVTRQIKKTKEKMASVEDGRTVPTLLRRKTGG
jgi:hypothetical protein